MSGRLQDRIAIVTGAGWVGPGWGNGRATCVRFAEEGAKIFAVDRDLASVAETVERVKAAGGGIEEQQGAGAIVNTASTSGLRWTGSAQVGYAATKAGVIQLSRVVAVQYAAKGIRVNTVVPGQLHTPMVEARLFQTRAGA